MSLLLAPPPQTAWNFNNSNSRNQPASKIYVVPQAPEMDSIVCTLQVEMGTQEIRTKHPIPSENLRMSMMLSRKLGKSRFSRFTCSENDSFLTEAASRRKVF